MINHDGATKEKINKHNSNSSRIPDHPSRILINGSCGSGNTNALFNMIKTKRRWWL